jgi:hypothetical protein
VRRRVADVDLLLFRRGRANPRYACSTEQQRELRWHENQGMKGRHEVYQRLGIALLYRCEDIFA